MPNWGFDWRVRALDSRFSFAALLTLIPADVQIITHSLTHLSFTTTQAPQEIFAGLALSAVNLRYFHLYSSAFW